MSRIIRWLLQMPLVVLILITLTTVVYSQKDGFKPWDILIFGGMTGVLGFVFWMSTFIGSPKVVDEEWKKRYLSNDGLFVVWGRRIIFIAALVKVIMILVEKYG